MPIRMVLKLVFEQRLGNFFVAQNVMLPEDVKT